MTRRLAEVVLSFAALLSLVASSSLLVAQPAGAQSSGSLELVAQSAWVDDGGIYDLQVRVAGADPASSVVLRVYPPWLERDDFLRLDLGGAEPVLELEPVPLGELQRTSNEVLSLQLGVVGANASIADPSDDEPPLDLLVTTGGSAVHPIEIVLLDPDGNVADNIITSMIELPRSQRNPPLRTAIILQSNLPNGMNPDGTSRLDAQVAEGLSVLVEAAATHPNERVALSILPESLVSLQRAEDDMLNALVDTMRETLDAEQLIPNPYVEIDEQAWMDSELTHAMVDLYAAGAEATTRTLGSTPDPSVMLLDRTVTGEGLDALTEIGVQGVIVRPAQIEALDRQIFPQAITTRFLVPTTENRTIPALVADGGLSNHFTNPGGAVYNANRLLADLTLLSLQNSDVRHAAVVLPPDDWTPNTQFLNVLLSGIERIPAIRGATPLDALSSTAFTPAQGIGTLSTPLQRDLRPRRQPKSLGSYRTEFSQAQAAIASWSSVIVDDRASTTRLDELLWVSADSRHTDDERSSYIDAIYELIDQQKLNSITTPANDTITLTGRVADLPIVIENNLDVDASVLLLLDSEKLSFPNGREVPIVLAPGPNRIDVLIEARAAGDSPIRIQVLSPDRAILLGSSEVLVRTFAFSGVGIVIGAAAIIVLVLWWLRHRRSTRDTVEILPGSPLPSPTEESLGV
jgi:hypothetical protein